MNRDELKSMPKEQVFAFIRDCLAFGSSIASSIRHVDHEAFKREHKRFVMSGYESRTGECTLHNLDVLNSFADLEYMTIRSIFSWISIRAAELCI